MGCIVKVIFLCDVVYVWPYDLQLILALQFFLYLSLYVNHLQSPCRLLVLRIGLLNEFLQERDKPWVIFRVVI